MNLQSKDVNDYTVTQLMDLFTLSPGFTEESLQLSRQKLMMELPRLRSTGMGQQHEVALFIDCACNRLRDEGTSSGGGTWAQQSNPLMKGAGSHAVQSNPNSLAGKNGVRHWWTAGRGWRRSAGLVEPDQCSDVRFRHEYRLQIQR